MEIIGQFGKTCIQDISGQNCDDIVGNIRINQKSYTDAFINNPDGGADIYIEGIDNRNSALDGDLVKVRLNSYSNWKLNHNLIAAKWDDWSEFLLPIIENIERDCAIRDQPQISLSNEVNSGQGTPESNQAPALVNNENNQLPIRSKRNKRSVQEKDGPKKATIIGPSKLPSNLPSGIAKLQVDHVIHLPLSAECIQKTGVVVEVIKRNHMGVAGGFLRKHSAEYAIFSPTDSRVPRMLVDIQECPLDFATTPERYKNVLFVAQMNCWNGGKSLAQGNLVKIVGDSNKLQSRMEALLLEHQIYDHDFPSDVYAELEYLNHLPSNWFEENSKGRRDLTKECVLTIDPKTARDLDDAVHVKQVAEQIYEVGVHIADVSYFVKELTAVDFYARQRTTSVYLVDRVIPMLPRILCEQMCSLNPGEPKLTFSVIWKMDKYGRIIDEWFGRTIIKSCAKLAYEQAQDMIENPDDVSWIREGTNMPKLHAFNWKYISKSVNLLNKIAQNLRAKRFEDGALRIDQVKIKFELDPESGFPTGFTFEDRTEANYLIEEYMLLANMAVAKKIYQYSQDFAFLRRHPPSSLKLMKEVKEFCDAKGCPLDITSSGSLQKSLNDITDPTMMKVVSFLLLKSMKNAEYVCAGYLPRGDISGFRHFALNVPFYTHFTSPIRRYADVIVHRLLALALDYEKESNEEVNSLSLMADECTKRKISSKIISDTSQKLYFNLFVQKAGFCELLACVTRIYDQSFEVILVDYDRTGRVYMDKLKPHLNDMKFESFSGIKRLVLHWKTSKSSDVLTKQVKKSKKKNRQSENNSQNQMDSRTSLESRKAFKMTDIESQVKEAKNDKQVIEVFDVIRVIVTAHEKDITQLNISLKVPDFAN